MARGKASPQEKARLKALRKKHGLGEFAPKGGKKKAKPKGKAVAQRAAKATGVSPPKKLTVTKGLDLFAMTAPGLRYAVSAVDSGDPDKMYNAVGVYTGFDPKKGDFDATRLIRGYGGSVNRAIEKKAFKVLRIRPPRTQLKTIGDALDHITYFGSTALEIYNNKGNVQNAIDAAYLVQNGIKLDQSGKKAYAPERMIKEKIVPYVAQKYVRKGLRRFGMDFGGILS